MLWKAICLLALIACCATIDRQCAAADDAFREHIAPLLERRCLSCHNDQQRKGDFSLQSLEAAMVDGYIQPGNSRASHLLDLITPVDGSAEMPKDADPLSDDQIQHIRNWIDSGAQWPQGLRLQEAEVADFDWWSYQPLERPPVPPSDDAWIRNPIDSFVHQQLIDHGLSHSAEADRRTLLRRLSYDLTGLPPTPMQMEDFLQDRDPRAYENLVDRLLESEHYGERWARHWLDVVKYADTCGYDKDKLRPNAWPYRDYVIRSFNEDKPYARFVQEQIAGDVLFPGQADGVLGLGFIAAGPWDFIGHVEVAESKIDGQVARNLDRDDMVSNALNTFCSVTIQCARCHNHKFDPFTQQHYYGLQSIFAAVDRAERPYDLDPQVEVERRKLDEQWTQLKAELQSLEQEIDQQGGERLAQLRAQVAELNKQQQVSQDSAFGYHSGIADSQASPKWIEVLLDQPSDVTRVVLHPCHDDFAGIGSGFGFPLRFKVEVSTDASAESESWTVIADHTLQDFRNPGLVPVAIPCDARQVRRVRLSATKLAERRNDFILALAELRVFGSPYRQAADLASDASQPQSMAIGIEAVSALDSIEAPPRWQKSNLIDGKWAQGAQPDIDQQLAESDAELNALLAKLETPQRTQRRELLKQSIAEVQQQRQNLPQGKMVYAAATHFAPNGNFKPTGGTPRPISVLHRGDVTSPAEPAPPSVLPLQADADCSLDPALSEAERRAQLAKWLTRPEHPLVWRSIVNRVWQFHFGDGIVATPNDFGRMGAQPTHPELLDWLACEFRDGRQSFKDLHRLIVTSSVYRQSCEHHAANAAIDASNQYLWRANRRRLSAEEIRDSILSVSGILDRSPGGPGFYLFELERPEHSPHYEYHKFDPADSRSHRRSIYRFIVRSQPNPWMTTLDCADSSQSTPKRNETLTSLQALSLLNNRFNLYAAEQFAQRLQQQAQRLDEQVALAVRLTLQRPATEQEQVEFIEFSEAHGLNNLCRFLFNLSEFVYVD